MYLRGANATPPDLPLQHPLLQFHEEQVSPALVSAA